jgi:hypothetical protein
MADSNTHNWRFAARFRRNAFGWRSQSTIQRVREAMAEIRKAARRDPVLAADGAVLFLEKVSPALEQVDSSSGTGWPSTMRMGSWCLSSRKRLWILSEHGR